MIWYAWLMKKDTELGENKVGVWYEPEVEPRWALLTQTVTLSSKTWPI